MVKQKLVVIYGCHGAGKTTLAKNILLSDGDELITEISEYGKYTKTKNNKYVAVGSYKNKTGGMDTVNSIKEQFALINELSGKYSNLIAEGIMFSSLLNKPLKLLLKLKYENNINITLILLYASVETSYKRTTTRNGKKPNIKNIINKQKSVIRVFKKIAELNEFNLISINTENKTPEQVFKEFKERTNNG